MRINGTKQELQLRTELALANANNHQRNLALDALHYVWCSGGCEGGVHRFGEHPPLTEEIVRAAVENTRRLVAWFNNASDRKLSDVEIKTRWEESQKLRDNLDRWAEREAAVCPEDFGFEEVIAARDKAVAWWRSRSENAEEALAEAVEIIRLNDQYEPGHGDSHKRAAAFVAAHGGKK